MRKKSLVLALITAFVFGFATSNSAQTQTEQFIVSATVPQATGISINASRVVDNNFSPVSSSILSFDPLAFNEELGIFLPRDGQYYAIDVGSVGGAGKPEVVVTYNDGLSPNGSGDGLGKRATATFLEVVQEGNQQSEVPISAVSPTKKLLEDVSGIRVRSNDLPDGFLRIYLGVYTGDQSGTFPDPAGGAPFTLDDEPGEYTGTLVISATI